MKRMKLGNLLIWLNWFALFALGLRLGVLTTFYMEHTKAFKVCLIWFIIIATIQAILHCIKYDK